MLMKAMIGSPNYKLNGIALVKLCALGSGYERIYSTMEKVDLSFCAYMSAMLPENPPRII